MIGVRTLVPALVASALVVTLAACGGAGEGAGAPAAKSPDARGAEPSTVEEAQAQIAAAKAQLGPAADASQPSAASAAPASSGKRRSTSTESNESKPSGAAVDHCEAPCRALASMRRAVGALCRMTGDDDARCVDAKHTLADSEGRIAPCAC